MPWANEEANKHVFKHASNAAKDFRKLSLKPVDSDANITAVSFF